MVPNNEKLLEAFIGGLPRSIEGNVTASKPQTLEEAINISQSKPDLCVARNASPHHDKEIALSCSNFATNVIHQKLPRPKIKPAENNSEDDQCSS
ncbi:hypothetical protein Tco_0319852 [Tanacetum coccineum]